MKNEVRLLNLLCIVAALLFIGFAVMTVVSSPQLLTTDNLFVIMVSLLLALVFAVNPLLYLKSEGKLPIPFMKRAEPPAIGSSTPPLLDAKGRAMPPDVRSMVTHMRQSESKDAS